MPAAGESNQQAVPVKRALFSRRPAWAASADDKQPQTGTEEIFTRRTQTYADILERHQRRRETKSDTNKRRSSEQDALVKDDGRDNEDDRSANKHRRISEETYAMYGLETPLKKQRRLAEATRSVELPEELDGDDIIAHERAKRRLDTTTESSIKGVSAAPMLGLVRQTSGPDPSQVIALSDGEEETEEPSSPPLDPDDPFPELTALARQRQKQSALEAQSSTPDAPKVADDVLDPVIKVLVTSPIKNTKPLLVHRRLRQRFMEIRTVWCQRQGFNEEMTQQVFLTYRMMRLYDVTTCKSLGIKVDISGNVIDGRRKDAYRSNDVNGDDDDSQGRIHVVAVTAEIFEDMQKEREEARLAKPELPADETATEEQTAASGNGQEAVPVETKVRLVLKGKGYEDYKLIVRPTTTFERIINAFRKERKVPIDIALSLVFDGETLDPQHKVEDSEVEDKDCLEIHTK